MLGRSKGLGSQEPSAGAAGAIQVAWRWQVLGELGACLSRSHRESGSKDDAWGHCSLQTSRVMGVWVYRSLQGATGAVQTSLGSVVKAGAHLTLP